jgi:hypothetical protein
MSSPVDNGWIKDNMGILIPKLMNRGPAPVVARRDVEQNTVAWLFSFHILKLANVSAVMYM